MGRPKVPIDEDQVRKLAEKQWSNEQIAAFIGVDRRCLERRLSQLIQESKQKGRAKLIDVLWQRAVFEKSDKLLLHALNRFLGPIEKKVSLDVTQIPKEQKKAILGELVRDLETEADVEPTAE